LWRADGYETDRASASAYGERSPDAATATAMQILQGIAVSPGIAIGEARIITSEGYRIRRRRIAAGAVDSQLERLGNAFAAVADDLERQRSRVAAQMGERYAAIFAAHAQILADPTLRVEVESLVRDQCWTADYAVHSTLSRYAGILRQVGGDHLAERASDLQEIELSLLQWLNGEPRSFSSRQTSPAVVLGRDLTPGEAANLDRKFTLAFAIEMGSAGGHAAIVAQGLEIPAVVGVGPFLGNVSDGDLVIVDGDQGQLILDPDDATLSTYRVAQENRRLLIRHRDELSDLPAQTTDGVPLQILANIEFPLEAESCRSRGADGIGLYRTEFLYLSDADEPDEEGQFRAYSAVVTAMEGRPVTIRTLDLGADKMGRGPRTAEEPNPSLGLRSIRLSLRHPTGFLRQMRAILRASALGAVQLMFPMITTISELRRAKALLADAMEDLTEQGLPFDRQLPVGMMVETPASVVLIERFLREVDFVSIGTNDLIQYTLAVDRANLDVSDLYSATDPAVLRLIMNTVQAANASAVPVSLCGQMSGSAVYCMLLIGMGLRSLSVPSLAIPEIKQVCRKVSRAQCEAVARNALAMDNAREVEIYLREEFKKAAPELVAPTQV